jgi:acyl carrier protein
LKQVQQAVVIARDDGPSGKYLAAYLVMIQGQTLDCSQLRTHLSATLPQFMLPSTYTELAALPLTINGKLDRRNLPQPTFDNEQGYVAPRNALQSALCDVWQQVLAVDRVGIEDNFFALGGNSISAVRLSALSLQQIGREVPLALLFIHKTVSGLAAHLDQHQGVVIAVEQCNEPQQKQTNTMKL